MEHLYLRILRTLIDVHTLNQFPWPVVGHVELLRAELCLLSLWLMVELHLDHRGHGLEISR